MEDIKRRIQFQNCGIQIQAVWKIYQEIEKKRVGQAPLSEDSPEISELGLLLDGVCESDSLVAHVSGVVLLTLVQNDILHFTRALNMLLATAPSVACVSVLVRTVHQLLLMEALQTVASKACPYTSPYGLRTAAITVDFTLIATLKKSWPARPVAYPVYSAHGLRFHKTCG